MKKSFLALVLILVAILSLMSFHRNGLSQAQIGTKVSGTISTDTIWKKAESPFILVGPLLVKNGATLTIEPGVSIDLSIYYIMVNGTLRAIGTTQNRIIINGGSSVNPPYGISFSVYSSPWNDMNNTGSIIENSIINSTLSSSVLVKISENSIVGTIGPESILTGNTIIGMVNAGDLSIVANNTIRGTVNAKGGPQLISNNTIMGESISNGINLDLTDNALILNNSISGCFSGISVSGQGVVERNLVFNNRYGMSVGGGSFGVMVLNNTLFNNTVGFQQGQQGAPLPTIAYNNFQNNTDYNFYLASHETTNINASYNWWGTSEVQRINQTIYDSKDEFDLGAVVFVPFLISPNLQSPSIFGIAPSPSTTSPIPEFPTFALYLLISILLLLSFFVKRLAIKHPSDYFH